MSVTQACLFVNMHAERMSLCLKPGMVEGKVLEILKDDTTVGGKSVRASEDNPQLRLESSKSGKEVCYVCPPLPPACLFTWLVPGVRR